MMNILNSSYVQILRRLDECYDQIIHPQKRRLLRHVLDGTIGRMLEVKQELVKLELTDFSYFDDIITSLKLIPVGACKDMYMLLVHRKLI